MLYTICIALILIASVLVMAIAIVVLSLAATLAMDRSLVADSNLEISKDAKALQERVIESEAAATMPQAEIPSAGQTEQQAE